ncbi:MAG: hypothetical protein IKD59_05565 [Lachnospiraceae bacterium]|nr:hypothetical protein [Lachnospiraceae bacterium]
MNVVYCVTASYIDKIKPSIRSLREHNKAKIYLLTEADSCDIEDVEVIDIRDQQYFPKGGVNYNNQFTYIGLLKVCYQSYLKCDKVIHLDADTIVCDSLKGMWDTDLKGKWYGMAQEKKGWYKPFGDIYYNAGVMVINLKQLRKDGIQDEMVSYLNTKKQPWCEQDAFIKYGLDQDKIVEIDVRYNENQFTGFTDNPAIVHYAGISDWWTNRNMGRAELLTRYR